MRRLNKIPTIWSAELAYAIGLIATDGCLYNDGRHLAFVSKDLQLIKTFKSCLGLTVKISKKQSGFKKGNYAYWVQFGDVNFYNFLLGIGLTPRKSKTLGAIKIPDIYFFDFLRGSFDGDGTFYSYWDKRWASSFMFYLEFLSASKYHLEWIRGQCRRLLSVDGHMNEYQSAGVHKLKYAKKEAVNVIGKIYYKKDLPMLERKYRKVYNALAVNQKNP